MWNISEKLSDTPYFFCRNRDLGTISVYMGYRDVCCLPPYMHIGLLNDVEQLVVVADELYVCDTDNHRLQVFSLTGEHRRSITGEWRSPRRLCFAKDRLYLVECDPEMEDHEEDEDGESAEPAFPLQGRRILVLSLQGDILQVVTHPTEPTAKFTSICCFDRKLLANFNYYTFGRSGMRSTAIGVLALRGL
jgi:hypothetical protein